jgi:putative intracellular protease/amidase
MMRRTLLLCAMLLAAAGPPVDPDWPCQQRLVPTLTAATFWPGLHPKGDWQTDPKLAALVRDVSARSRPVAEAVKRLESFAATRPGEEALAEVFAGLVDQANAERGAAIDGLRSVTRYQRALAEATSRVTAELEALPQDAPPAQRDEVVSRRALMIRQYEEIQRSIRYSCEIPVDIESRLGRFAQALQQRPG